MSSFHFSKVIAGVWPTLAKETVLSKIINMVDVFKISLWGGFDDNNKKYIDTLMKLDNSKTIMLETRWNDVRVKNFMEIKLKEKQVIEIEYSEYAQENAQKIFIDATFIGKLKAWQQIIFEQSWVVLKIKSVLEDSVMAEVITAWEIAQYDRVLFKDYDIELPFFSERERRDILRWLEYWVHIISASIVRSKNDIFELKEFLSSQNAEKIKIFAKIETAEAIKNIDEIIEVSDWIILIMEKIKPLLKQQKINEEDIIREMKLKGKPIVMSFWWIEKNNKDTMITEQEIKKYSQLCVDCYMLNTLLKEDDTIEIITQLSNYLEKYELSNKDEILDNCCTEDDSFFVRDYIIYNAYRATKEVDIKAMVSFTENGYTSAKLSSLAPKVPVIAFTKVDETYRYINMLWWVRWYKISQSFSYDNLKRVGKEMIRIIFKWNISLDDKIIIVQANEIIKDEKTGMINGLELYKFKNI